MVSRPQAEAMAVAPNPTFEGGPFPRPSRARSFLLRHPALNLCLSAVLWLVLLCAFCAFVVITLGRPTAFWDLPSHKAARKELNIDFPAGSAPLAPGGSDVALVRGRNMYWFILVFLSSMVAAMVASLIMWKRHTAPVALKTGLKRVDAVLDKANAVVHRILFYQLPPRRLWYWWCGGLTPLNSFIYGFFLTYLIIYLYYEHEVDDFPKIARKIEVPVPIPNATEAQMIAFEEEVEDMSYEFTARRLKASGKICGQCIRLMWLLLYFPVSRSNFLKWAFGQDFSTIIKYHRWLGYLTVWMTLVHGLLFYILWGAEGTWEKNVSAWSVPGCTNDSGDSCNYLAGNIAGWVALIILVTSVAWVRKNYYYVFYRIHVLGFLLYTIFAFMHYNGMVYWVMPGMFLYALDRTFRGWQAGNIVWSLHPSDIRVNKGVVSLRLRWKRGTHITPGQTVWLRFPGIALFQSHPFSIAAVHPGGKDPILGGPTSTIHMRALGPWTRKLALYAEQGRPLTMQVEGPYDTSLAVPPTGEAVVMLAGGLGVTPLLALLREYEARRSRSSLTGPEDVPQAVYVSWTCRAACELQMLDAGLLQEAAATASKGAGGDEEEASAARAGGWLHLSIHYTGYELDQVGMGGRYMGHKALDVADAPGKGGESIRLSEDGRQEDAPNNRLLTSNPGNNPFVVIPCLALCFLGGWAGIILASYYEGYPIRTTPSGIENSAAVGILQVVAIALGAMLPPFMLLLLLHIVGLVYAHVRRGNQGGVLSSQAGKAINISVAVHHAPLGQPTVELLPGYKIACCQGTGHEGVLQMERGRARACNLLRHVRAEHANLALVQVLVGGPEPMWHDALEACHVVNSEGRGPFLSACRVAHVH